jgi:quinol monooxygenase YgiN
MLTVHVSLRVKPDCVESFRRISLENARCSLQESEVLRFDVLQQIDDTARFLLVEVYRSEEGPTLHRQTAHFEKWRSQAEPMLAEPRTRTLYDTLLP